MAAYESTTRLTMEACAARAREFFELEHGLRARDRMGTRLRWIGPERDTIELRLFPVRGGGTRIEIETLHSDELVLDFIRALPRFGLVDELRRRWRRPGEG